MEDQDIILLTKSWTHESSERGLPQVNGYQWKVLHRRGTCQGTSRRLQVLPTYLDGSHMSIYRCIHEIQTLDTCGLAFVSESKTVYIAFCYNPPKGSRFATKHVNRVGT